MNMGQLPRILDESSAPCMELQFERIRYVLSSTFYSLKARVGTHRVDESIRLDIGPPTFAMHIDPSAIFALQLQLLQRKNMAEPSVAVYITTSAEWDYLRPIITKLYIDENWELPKLVKEIERSYGFKATWVYCAQSYLHPLQIF